MHEKLSDNRNVETFEEVEFRDLFRFIFLNRRGAYVGGVVSIFLSIGWIVKNPPTKVSSLFLIASSDSGPSLKDFSTLSSWLNQSFDDIGSKKKLSILEETGENSNNSDFGKQLLQSRFEFTNFDNNKLVLNISHPSISNIEKFDSKKFLSNLNSVITERYKSEEASRLANFDKSLKVILNASESLDDSYKNALLSSSSSNGKFALELFEIQKEFALLDSKNAIDHKIQNNLINMADQLKVRAAELFAVKKIDSVKYEEVFRKISAVEIGLKNNSTTDLPKTYVHNYVGEILNRLESTIKTEFDPRRTRPPELVFSSSESNINHTVFELRKWLIFSMSSTVFFLILGLIVSGILRFFSSNRAYITGQ